jgi:GT2 family glycosyltransferase/CMP-N-acetylneuraminic acid synthetase
MNTKVSIIITAHNYAKWLPKAVESTLNQQYESYEVIVVDDGSTDHTQEILEVYKDDPRIKIITTEGLGLARACNRGISEASGEYIIRLDADDYFDENILLVLAAFLEKNPTVGMVFCDYYTIDTYGEIIDQARRQKVNDEVELLDRPALAAGAMYRRSCYDAIGGYNETIRFQEDYDFWIKFIEKYQVRNVSLPLMYYRQHGKSMSRNWEGRMQTRRKVKKKFVEEHRDYLNKKILAVIPSRGELLENHKFPMLPMGETTLLQRCIDQLKDVEAVDRIIVSTEDAEIAKHAEEVGAEVPYLRSISSTSPAVPFENSILDLLDWLKVNDDYCPDIIVIRHPHTPFLTDEHVSEAINSMLLYGTDTVLSVMEDLTYHWKVGRVGLEPVGYKKRVVKQEKDLIFKEVGGLYIFSAPLLVETGSLVGGRIGHIEVAPYNALRIQSPFEYWVAKKMAEDNTGW